MGGMGAMFEGAGWSKGGEKGAVGGSAVGAVLAPPEHQRVPVFM
jgi:hypothetical protein